MGKASFDPVGIFKELTRDDYFVAGRSDEETAILEKTRRWAHQIESEAHRIPVEDREFYRAVAWGWLIARETGDLNARLTALEQRARSQESRDMLAEHQFRSYGGR